MKKKIIGILVMTLLISSVFIPLAGSINSVISKPDKNYYHLNIEEQTCCFSDGTDCYAHSGQQSGTLYSEEIDLTGYATPAELSFDTYYEMLDPNSNGYLDISYDWNGVSPPNTAIWNPLYIFHGTPSSPGGDTITHSISNSCYVRFRYEYAPGSGDYGWLVFNFNVNDNTGNLILEENFESDAVDWQFFGGWYIRCTNCIDLNKTVKDPETHNWVDEAYACIGTEVSIRLKVCNCGESKLGQNHPILYVWDTLPNGLEYVAGSSTPFEPTINNNVLKWTFFEDVHEGLYPNDCLIIEFNVEVVLEGQNKNCADLQIEANNGVILHDTDCAIINGVNCSYNISMIKQVRDIPTGNWQDVVYANVGDIVECRILLCNHESFAIDPNYLIIRDYMPSGLQIVPGSINPTSGTITSYGIEWAYGIGGISPNNCFSVGYYKVEVTTIGDHINTAEMEVHWWNLPTDYLDDDANIIAGFTSDIDGTGSLNWDDIKAGSTVTGTIQISNIGAEESDLNWEVAEYPNWGTWTFNPSSGTNLKPEDGPVQVEVEVEAPDEKNKEFGGEVKIINTDNPSDNFTISVSLSTPRIRQRTINIYLLKTLKNYEFLHQIIQQILQI